MGQVVLPPPPDIYTNPEAEARYRQYLWSGANPGWPVPPLSMFIEHARKQKEQTEYVYKGMGGPSLADIRKHKAKPEVSIGYAFGDREKHHWSRLLIFWMMILATILLSIQIGLAINFGMYGPR